MKNGKAMFWALVNSFLIHLLNIILFKHLYIFFDILVVFRAQVNRFIYSLFHELVHVFGTPLWYLYIGFMKEFESMENDLDEKIDWNVPILKLSTYVEK